MYITFALTLASYLDCCHSVLANILKISILIIVNEIAFYDTLLLFCGNLCYFLWSLFLADQRYFFYQTVKEMECLLTPFGLLLSTLMKVILGFLFRLVYTYVLSLIFCSPKLNSFSGTVIVGLFLASVVHVSVHRGEVGELMWYRVLLF